MKNYLVWSAAALMLAACSSNEEETVAADNRVPVEFSASVGVTESRAIDQTWSSTDAIGIYMVDAGKDFKEANISENAANVRYVVDASQANAFKADGTTIYYPMDGSAVDFYAYYPQGSNAVTKDATSGNYVYALDVALQSDQEALDFLYSNNVKGKCKTDKTVALSFAHQLCKVVLTVEDGDGVAASDLAGLTVQVNGQNTTATFDLTTGTVKEDAAAPAAITLLKQADAYVYEAILLPDATTSRTFVFTLSNGEAFTWNMDKALVSGSKYIYTVKLNRTGVTVTGNIQNWTPEDGGEVDAD